MTTPGPRQLPLDLPVHEAQGRDQFFVSGVNRLALAAVDGWRDWPGGKMLLVGPRGAGKTHLAAIWAADSGAAVVEARDLAGVDLRSLPARVVVENADAGGPAAQEPLFHLHNLILPEGRLLITAAMPPRDWGLTLPDLTSRMQATPLTRLEAPDDALLFAVLIKLFADRQMTVPPTLIAWLLVRMDRSIGAARDLVARLDAEAMAQCRPIGRALAAEVLDKS